MTKKSLDRALQVVFVIWLLLLGALYISFRPVAHKSAEKNYTNAQLQRWYEGVNEEYFANKLPKDTTIKWADLTPLKDMGTTMRRSDGGFAILLDPVQNPNKRTAALTAYHEMCHVAVPVSSFEEHGAKFQACMLHLAEVGAFKDLW